MEQSAFPISRNLSLESLVNNALCRFPKTRFLYRLWCHGSRMQDSHRIADETIGHGMVTAWRQCDNLIAVRNEIRQARRLLGEQGAVICPTSMTQALLK
jgi:hypothetical protein